MFSSFPPNRERVTRYQYYLQLRDNFLYAAQMVGAERCFLLAAYALQADLGAYNAHKHARAYFDPREYFPAWVSKAMEWSLPLRDISDIHSRVACPTGLEFVQ